MLCPQGTCKVLGSVSESSCVYTCRGIDNLLYSADADFSCFADLAITSPVDYYRDGQGSLLQCVLTPADPYMPLSNEEIAARVHKQVSQWLSFSSSICSAGSSQGNSPVQGGRM